MNLGDLADIRTGLVLSRKKGSENKSAMKYKLLTLKSFMIDGYINPTDLDEFITDQHLSNEYITQINDVIIRLSEPNIAVCIGKEMSGIVIPSLFGIIKLHSDNVLPEYLAWYLNSKFTKVQLRRSQVGSVIPIINTSSLNHLQVEKLSVTKQEKIIEMNRLYLCEKVLLTQLLSEKETFYKAATNLVFNNISRGE